VKLTGIGFRIENYQVSMKELACAAIRPSAAQPHCRHRTLTVIPPTYYVDYRPFVCLGQGTQHILRKDACRCVRRRGGLSETSSL